MIFRSGFLLTTRRSCLGINGRDENVVFEVKEQERKEGQDGTQGQAEMRKDVVGRNGSIPVPVEGSIDNQILIGKNNEDSEKKANGKGSGESLQDEGSENAEEVVDNASPYRTNDHGLGTSLIVQIHR